MLTCVILIEALEGMMAQDMNIYQLAIKNKKGIVIMVKQMGLSRKQRNQYHEGV